MGYGEGGYLTLLNGTRKAWTKSDQYTYQLLSANLPDRLEPGQAYSCYIQYDQGLLTTRSDTQGKFTYKLEGTDQQISIEIRDEPSTIRVSLNFPTLNNPAGSVFDLGWIHEGAVRFILSESGGSYSSSNPPVDWMQANLGKLGNRPLSKICLPGTHDSGMWQITYEESVPTVLLEMFSLCQSSNIGGQLADGARYFDIRPIIGSGDFWTGHYDQHSGHGARGQKISEIVDNINAFTESNKELIILNISHDINTDSGYADFTSDEWNRLFNQLRNIKALCALTPDEAKSIKDLPLNRFIGSRSAAVLVIFQELRGTPLPIDIPGFFTLNNLNVYNSYAEKVDVTAMANDQFQKLDRRVDNPWDVNKQLFLLSWTLTQEKPSFSNWKTSILGFKSIKANAEIANKSLFELALPHCNQNTLMPNIIYVDYLSGRDFTALAMAINDVYHP